MYGGLAGAGGDEGKGKGEGEGMINTDPCLMTDNIN